MLKSPAIKLSFKDKQTIAFLLFNKARQGDIKAQLQIGELLELFENGENADYLSIKRSTYWYTQAANQTSSQDDANKAAGKLGMDYAQQLKFEPDNPDLRYFSIKYLEQGANGGNQFNTMMLSVVYDVYIKDPVKASQWLLKAAEQGYSRAYGYLALRYANGNGVRTDYKKARNWAEKGIEADKEITYGPHDTNSYGAMGILYENGWGVKVNKKKALSYYGQACDLGDNHFCEIYNDLYRQLH